MANINVSYQDIISQAQSLQRGKEEINSQLTAMRTQIGNLVSGGFVTDSASGAFHQSYEQFTAGATQTISALDQLAANLNMVANTLQETDQQLAQQLGS
ncbi:MAG: WXG100 family type VII secretion target [Actinomycetales bacterium]|nr:WXG100 family type VII secretion target [Actinomycetales bacterium]